MINLQAIWYSLKQINYPYCLRISGKSKTKWWLTNHSHTTPCLSQGKTRKMRVLKTKVINVTEKPIKSITSYSPPELQAEKIGPTIDSEIIQFLSFFILQYGVNQSTLKFFLSYTMMFRRNHSSMFCCRRLHALISWGWQFVSPTSI